jgi:hypothetical protein
MSILNHVNLGILRSLVSRRKEFGVNLQSGRQRLLRISLTRPGSGEFRMRGRMGRLSSALPGWSITFPSNHPTSPRRDSLPGLPGSRNRGRPTFSNAIRQGEAIVVRPLFREPQPRRGRWTRQGPRRGTARVRIADPPAAGRPDPARPGTAASSPGAPAPSPYLVTADARHDTPDARRRTGPLLRHPAGAPSFSPANLKLAIAICNVESIHIANCKLQGSLR